MGCGAFLPTLRREDEFHPSLERPGDFDEHYRLAARLGKGTEAQTFIAKLRTPVSAPPEKRAVKVVNIRADGYVLLVDDQRLRDVRREAFFWQMASSHRNCVQLVETFLDSRGKYMLVMERCTCNLTEWLRAGPTASFQEVADMFRQLLLGLEFLHGIRLVHRDVKPDNILFGGEDRRVMKLTDFGSAARLPQQGVLKGFFGDPPFMSPEMLSGSGYTAQTDLWSLGAIAYMMFYMDLVHSPVERTPASIKMATLVGAPEPTFVARAGYSQVPPDAEVFVRELVQRDPAKRATAAQALQLEYVNQEDVSWDETQTLQPPWAAGPLSGRSQAAGSSTNQPSAILPTSEPDSRRSLPQAWAAPTPEVWDHGGTNAGDGSGTSGASGSNMVKGMARTESTLASTTTSRSMPTDHAQERSRRSAPAGLLNLQGWQSIASSVGDEPAPSRDPSASGSSVRDFLGGLPSQLESERGFGRVPSAVLEDPQDEEAPVGTVPSVASSSRSSSSRESSSTCMSEAEEASDGPSSRRSSPTREHNPMDLPGTLNDSEAPQVLD